MDAYDIARFWSKVDVRGKNECWPWLASKNGDGYGEFKFDGRIHGTHRVAHVLFTGENIDGKVVRHACDNPGCCNPYHTSTGAHVDNVRDRVTRGRSANGEVNGRAVLLEHQVISIKSDPRSNRELGAIYGVHQDTIRAIRNGKTWRHLDRD